MLATYKGYTINKKSAWHNGETLYYYISINMSFLTQYFSSLGEAQDYIRSELTPIVCGGE